MITGTFTALVTPFNGEDVDYEGLDKLSEFQIRNGITGILAVGTTGESPSLVWEEHNKVIEHIRKSTAGKALCIAGTGSNNTKEAMAATEHAVKLGAEAVLLVDPYYNGPSSLEIRNEYVAPIAEKFPNIEIIPYVIPGRTGTQLLPEDIAILNKHYPNVSTVKEATADIGNMKRTRECCGSDFSILSGDDGMTFEMMTNESVRASGVISVVSNIVPKAVAELVHAVKAGDIEKAAELNNKLKPFFELVTLKTMEKSPYGDVVFRARNPLAAKTLMTIIGMPSGGCRRPIGKLTKNALDVVLNAARKVLSESPEILEPAASFFNVDIESRLEDSSKWKHLCYETY